MTNYDILLLTLMVSFLSGMEAMAIMLEEMLLAKTAMLNFGGVSSTSLFSPDNSTDTNDDETAANCCASFFDR